MSDSETRPPIKAEIKTDPLERYSNGSLYPYWDLKEGGLAPYLNIVRRTFASLNPFSHQQVPTTDRMAVGIKFGPHYYRDQVTLFSFSHTPTQPISTTRIPATTTPSPTRGSPLLTRPSTSSANSGQSTPTWLPDSARGLSTFTKDVCLPMMTKPKSASRSKRTF